MLADDFLTLLTPRPGTLTAPWLFAFRGGELLVAEVDDALMLPSANILDQHGITLDGGHCIGEWQGQTCFALDLPHDWTPSTGWQLIGLRATFPRLPEALFWIAGRAAQILEWDRNHRYCGRCGTPTEIKPGERARICPACGALAYPRLSPAMMALVIRGREVLLARGPHFAPGVFSALAGFVEPGETLEQTVAREVREEVGIAITNLRYFGSQPWPFPHSLMLAFTADYASGELTPDGVEIEAAEWFDIDAMPTLPFRVSIAHRLIAAVTAELREKYANT